MFVEHNREEEPGHSVQYPPRADAGQTPGSGDQTPGHYRALKGFLEVDGWLGISEAVFLYNLAGSIPDRESILVVEIGTWQGRSAVVLGQALADRKAPRVVCIDPFNADGDLASRKTYEGRARQTLREICVANLRKHGLDHVVQIIEGYSHDVIRSWGERFDLMFSMGITTTRRCVAISRTGLHFCDRTVGSFSTTST